jgi:hypothetical protein
MTTGIHRNPAARRLLLQESRFIGDKNPIGHLIQEWSASINNNSFLYYLIEVQGNGAPFLAADSLRGTTS